MAAIQSETLPITPHLELLPIFSRKFDLAELSHPSRKVLREQVASMATVMEEYADTCLQHHTHMAISQSPHPDFPDIKMRGQSRDVLTQTLNIGKTEFSRSADPRVISAAQPRLELSFHFPGKNGAARTMRLMVFEGGDMRITGIEKVVTGSTIVQIDTGKEVEEFSYERREATVDSRDFDSADDFLAQFNSDNPQSPTVIEDILEKIYQQVA